MNDRRRDSAGWTTLYCAMGMIIIAGVAMVSGQDGKAPSPGWTTRARVVRVVDGDTVDVEISRTVRVRMLDCWAPETRGESRPQGIDSKRHLSELLPPDRMVTLHVPTDADGNVSKIWTFGRVLGRVYAADTDLSEAQVDAGHATRTKAGP